jgi:hypothetical protein
MYDRCIFFSPIFCLFTFCMLEVLVFAHLCYMTSGKFGLFPKSELPENAKNSRKLSPKLGFVWNF